MYFYFAPIIPNRTELISSQKPHIYLTLTLLCILFSKPNGGADSTVEWKAFDSVERSYINFNTTISVEKSLAPKRVQLWNEMIDKANLTESYVKKNEARTCSSSDRVKINVFGLISFAYASFLLYSFY